MSIINAAFVCVFLFQIFLMCMFGQELMTENDGLLFQLYSSSWPAIIAASQRDEPKSCHQMLIIFMETLKEDKQIMIGKVFPLNLRTFSSVSQIISRSKCFCHSVIFQLNFMVLDIKYILPSICNTQVNGYINRFDIFILNGVDCMQRTT